MKVTLVCFFFCVISISVHAQCSVIISKSDLICHNECHGTALASATGDAPFVYSWSNGASTQMVYGLCAETYSLTVTDNNGCVAAGSVIIDSPTPLTASIVDYTFPDTGLCNGTIAATASNGTPPYMLSYLNCIDSVVNSGPIIVDPHFCAGSYAVIITDANNCTDTTDCIFLTEQVVSVKDIRLNLPYTFLSNSISFLTPCTRFIIYDLAGRIVYFSQIETNEFDYSFLPAGVYAIQAQLADGAEFTEKLVIAKDE